MSNDVIAHFVDLNNKSLAIEKYDAGDLYLYSEPHNIFNGEMYNITSRWFIISSPISNFRLIKLSFKTKDNKDSH